MMLEEKKKTIDRHCERQRSNPVEVSGLPRRFAPRNDEKDFYRKLLRLVAPIFFVFCLSIPLFAQIGPVGPKSGDESVGSGTPSGDTKPVDLPYKPSGGGEKKRSPVERVEVEQEVYKPIPYISSKSPEPLGAPDPEF